MSTNGTHTATSAESSNAVGQTRPHLDRQSVDRRLEALRATIRSWDWRTAVVEVGSSPAEQLATSSLGATTSIETPQRSEHLAEERSTEYGITDPPPIDVATEQGSATTAATLQQIVTFPDEVTAPPLDDAVVPPMAPPAQPIPPSEAMAAQTFEASAPPFAPAAPHTEWVATSTPEVDDAATEDIAFAASSLVPATPYFEQSAQMAGNEREKDGASWFGQEPEPAPEPNGALRRLWAHRWTKLAIAAVAMAILVVLIVGGIRLFAKKTNSGGTATTTVTRSSSPAQHTNATAPISAAQLAQYQAIATAFQNGNVTATKGFVTAGSTPTPSRVVLVVVTYRTAVNLYNYQLHFIQWPPSMQSAVETDHAQLQALSSFLQAFSSVAPTGVPAWLSQLHDRANSTQVADNVVRQDLGMPASSSFP